LVEALNRVVSGETYIDPSIFRRVAQRKRQPDPLAALTPHQNKILSLLAEGRSNYGIAQQLDVKEGTVEKIIADIFAKLGMPDRHSLERRDTNVRVKATLRFLRSNGWEPPGGDQE
jgi:DNA-binding NarL/FixJ family response regulator